MRAQRACELWTAFDMALAGCSAASARRVEDGQLAVVKVTRRRAHPDESVRIVSRASLGAQNREPELYSLDSGPVWCVCKNWCRLASVFAPGPFGDLMGDLPDRCVRILRNPPQQFEGSGRIEVISFHDDAFGLGDDVAAGRCRLKQVLTIRRS